MSTLAEIEAAAENLSAQEKQELFLFLAARLRTPEAQPPEPRKFTREQMAAWIAEDEEEFGFPSGTDAGSPVTRPSR